MCRRLGPRVAESALTVGSTTLSARNGYPGNLPIFAVKRQKTEEIIEGYTQKSWREMQLALLHFAGMTCFGPFRLILWGLLKKIGYEPLVWIWRRVGLKKARQYRECSAIGSITEAIRVCRPRTLQLPRISHKRQLSSADSRATSGMVDLICPQHGAALPADKKSPLSPNLPARWCPCPHVRGKFGQTSDELFLGGVPRCTSTVRRTAPASTGEKQALLISAVVVTLLTICPQLTHGQIEQPVIVPPELLEFVDAQLPPDTPLLTGDVVLVLTIGESGQVSAVAIQSGIGTPFDEAAADAARKFLFRPAFADGKPIPVVVPFTYSFKLSERRGRIVEATGDRREPEVTPGQQVTGRLAEQGTRTPLAGIVVLLEDARTGSLARAVTDSEGVFQVTGLSAGTFRIQILPPGYEAIVRSVEVLDRSGDGDAIQDVGTWYTKPDGSERFRTVVTGDARPPAATEVVLTEQELTQTPGTFGDPTRVVATLPGVARSPFGFGYYAVRGSNFDNTGFFIDGHPALYLYHLASGPGVLPPSLVSEIQFYPGGYPADFGRFAGGVIAIDIADPPTDRWHLDVEVDVLKASALFSTPFDDAKGTLSVAVRRSYYELFVPLFVDDLSVSYTDYLVRLSYAISPKITFKLMFLGAEDRVDAGSTDDTPGEDSSQDIGLGFQRVTAAVDAEVDGKLTWSTSAAFEYDHTEGRRVAEDDDTLKVDIDGWFVQLRTWLDWAPLPSYRLRSGLDGLWSNLAADLRIASLPPLGDPLPPEFDPVIVQSGFSGPYGSIAPYLSADWEPVDGLRFLPGVRMTIDYWADTIHLSIDPKVAVRYRFHADWTLKAMTSIAHQPPPIFQVIPPYGDPELPPVQAWQSSAGVEWIPADGWEISVEGYFTKLENLARPRNIFTSEDGEVQRTNWSADVGGRSYGMELFIRKRMGDWVHGWLSYTLSRTERQFPPNGWTIGPIDQTHVVNLAWSFDLGDEWSLGTRFTLATGNPYYPIIGSRYDADRDRYQPIFATERARLPIFHRLDLRLDKNFRLDTWLLGFYLDIQNAYNASNSEGFRYSYDFGIRTAGVSLPILPTLGVHASF